MNEQNQAFHFNVDGDPQTQGSMRHVGNGRMIHKRELIEWRNKVQAAAVKAAKARNIPLPVDLPVAVSAVFRLPSPKRPRLPFGATGGDLDKLQRAIGDALSPRDRMKVLSNDSRIIAWKSSKHWVPSDRTGVSVEVVILDSVPKTRTESVDSVCGLWHDTTSHVDKLNGKRQEVTGHESDAE